VRYPDLLDTFLTPGGFCHPADNESLAAVHTTMFASLGITGPTALFDGPDGLEQLFDQSLDMRADDRSLTAVEQT
jgi:hypothetical protein